MRSARLGLLAVPVAFLAACTSVHTGRSGAVPSASATATDVGAAQNRAAAQTAADHLVAQVSLPPGAVRVSPQPAGLTGPAMGTPATSQLIDSIGYFVVSMSLDETQAWFRAHPQQGKAPSGTATVTSAGVRTVGFQYDLENSRASWGTATLDLSVAAQGANAAIRVDGIAQWIDPAPVRDTSPGPTIRVTVADGCPASDRGFDDVSNPDATDLDDRLVPVAAPTAGLSCTYDGMNGTPYALVGSSQLDAAQAAATVDHLRGLSLGSRGDGPHSCPTADARVAILAFSYPGRADVDIWQRTSGCSSTDNGHIVADGT